LPRTLRGAATAAAGAPEALLKGARTLSRQLASLASDEYARFLVLAGLIGFAAAMAVTVLYRVVDIVQHLTLGWAEALPVSEAMGIPLLVGVGLIASQAIVRFGAADSTGENVPDVMYRANLRGGVVPGRRVLAKSLAAAILIGSGGNVPPRRGSGAG
jgi:H+/Cl- antiporter ClcA